MWRVLGALFALSLFFSGTWGYSVQGNKIIHPNGTQILLRGVDRCSFEWNPVGEEVSLSDYQLMAGWGANIVRVTMNQDFWLEGSATYSSGYEAVIDQQVQWITSLNMAVILDLHWSDQGNLQTSGAGQQCMADVNSITFWTQVATKYKNNPNVIFELYNEPHDVAWDVWLNGGSGCSFEVAGMQNLTDAVRNTGANNLILVGGLNWAYDLSGVAQYPVQGENIAYVTHVYENPGKEPSDWDTGFGYLAATYPIVATEFGQDCNTDNYVQQLLEYFNEKQIHWTAWAWYVSGCGFPSIISDWKGTPTQPVGQLVYAALKGQNYTDGSDNGGGGGGGSTPATKNLVVFDGQLENGFTSYGWASDLTFTNTAVVYPGSSNSISFTPYDYNAVYLHYGSTFDPNSYASVQLVINGGSSGGQLMKVVLYDTEGNPAPYSTQPSFPSSVQAGAWVQQTISMSSFNIPSGSLCTGIAIQANSGDTQGEVYITDIMFVAPVAHGSTGSSSTTSPDNLNSASSIHPNALFFLVLFFVFSALM